MSEALSSHEGWGENVADCPDGTEVAPQQKTLKTLNFPPKKTSLPAPQKNKRRRRRRGGKKRDCFDEDKGTHFWGLKMDNLRGDIDDRSSSEAVDIVLLSYYLPLF